MFVPAFILQMLFEDDDIVDKDKKKVADVTSGTSESAS